MTNDSPEPATAPPKPPRDGESLWDGLEVQGGSLYWFGFPPLFYSVALGSSAISDIGLVYLMVGLMWPFAAGITYARVNRRRPRGSPSRALSAIAWAHAPWLLFIPLWSQMSTRDGLVAAFPPLYLWSNVCLWLALDSWRPRWTPTFWRWLGMGAWLIFALLAVLAAGAIALAVHVLRPT